MAQCLVDVHGVRIQIKIKMQKEIAPDSLPLLRSKERKCPDHHFIKGYSCTILFHQVVYPGSHALKCVA
jgi:hypothetical protein